MSRKPGNRRVLILPVEIAGYASRVQTGFREIGWEAEVLDLTGDPYGFGVDPPADPMLRCLAAGYRRASGLAPIGRVTAQLALLPLRVLATWSALRRRDALIYLFGRTLLWGIDLRLARALGIRTVAVYLGSDSRPPWMNGSFVNVDGVRWRLLRFRTWRTARRVRSMERLADVVVCHPATAQFLRQPCVNWLAIGMPVTLPEAVAPRGETRTGPLRVLHAPSRRRQKGSVDIEAAVARLVAEGVDISLETVGGVSNTVVREKIERADLVVDELYSDTFLGGIGVEAAAAGVPVLVFGYAGEILRSSARQLALPNRHYAPPEQLDKMLQRATSDSQWLAGVARELQEHIRQSATPSDVAERLSRVVADDVPHDWWIDPSELDYLLGFGMSREVAEDRLLEYITRFGTGALHLPADGAALRAARSVTSPRS